MLVLYEQLKGALRRSIANLFVLGCFRKGSTYSIMLFFRCIKLLGEPFCTLRAIIPPQLGLRPRHPTPATITITDTAHKTLNLERVPKC